jgi:hypothetical protein
MTHPCLLLTKFIANLTVQSAHLFTLRFKPALAGAEVSQAPLDSLAANYLPATDSSASARQPAWFIYGRVRRSAERMIIEWQTRRTAGADNFAIYRGRTLVWREARLLDLSIFATADGQTALTTYRAVDTTAAPPGPYYYWIVVLTAKQRERRYGPYSATLEEGER